MLAAQPACLLIADISGYTGLPRRRRARPRPGHPGGPHWRDRQRPSPDFRLAKLEGDAAFTFEPVERLDGSLLLDMVERCYFGFRRRRSDVRQATSCECNACVRIPDLDLKFVVHHGSVIRQQVAGREELVGADVILVHRLLKNDVVETAGHRGVRAVHGGMLDATGLDPEALGMARHAETYDHIGEVATWVQDLERRWQEEEERKRVFVGPPEAILDISVDVRARRRSPGSSSPRPDSA